MILVKPTPFDAQVCRHFVKVFQGVGQAHKMPGVVADVFHIFQIFKRLDTLMKRPLAYVATRQGPIGYSARCS